MNTAVRFSVAEFDRMIEQGVFADRPDQQIELIYGELREVSPPNPPHDFMIDLLMYWGVDHAPRDEVHIRIQNSLGIVEFDSVPEPDVAWMKKRNYRNRRPTPRDVLLLIEVSDTSLADDRRVKAELYASAGVKDYWIVNLKEFCIEVHRKPRNSEYRSVESIGIGQAVSPLAFPDLSLAVTSLFAN